MHQFYCGSFVLFTVLGSRAADPLPETQECNQEKYREAAG